MRPRILLSAVLGMALLAAACSDAEYAAPEPAPLQDTLDVSEVLTILPDTAGRELVEISCVPCHSLRYIEMQPRMARKGWEKIVAKMITAYGAPVRDSASAKQIVDYLAHIKGT